MKKIIIVFLIAWAQNIFSQSVICSSTHSTYKNSYTIGEIVIDESSGFQGIYSHYIAPGGPLNNLKEDFIYNIAFYPNPSNYIIRLEGRKTDTDKEVYFYNMDGIEFNLALINNEINIESIPQGVYFTKIESRILKVIKI